MTGNVKRIYIGTAMVWLNSSLFVLVAILACYLWVWIREPRHAGNPASYSSQARASALHTLPPGVAARFLSEFDNLNEREGYIYRPWVGFSERVYHSALLNIDDASPLPVRRTIQSPVPARQNKTIWVFGGSTQFGWGVPDDQTIASHLSALLSTDRMHYDVINRGHTFYYSSQELALFIALLRHGGRCDIAVFLDGLNDVARLTDDSPNFTDRTAAGFLLEENAAAASNARQIVVTSNFPPVRILKGLVERLSPKPSADRTKTRRPDVAYDPVRTYRFNISAIQKLAEGENIGVAFFWQPTPFDYIAGAGRDRNEFQETLPGINASVRKIPDKQFHFIADLFGGETFEDVYVDRVHYGDKGCRLVARKIAATLAADGLLR